MLTPARKQIEAERHTRWMLHRDMDEVVAIDRSHVWQRWSESEYIYALRSHDCIGVVTEDHRGAVMAFMIYRMGKTGLNLDRICVHLDHLRDGYGAELIERLISNLSPMKRTAIWTDVRYDDLPAQLFFQSQGFIATPLADSVCFTYTMRESEFHQ